jgi:glycerol-3-phosphate acyltransferase PlsX
MQVALDAMGGDHAPQATVAGAVLAARELGIPVCLVGHGDVIRAELAKHQARELPLTIHHAPDVVRMDESPLAALRRKPGCSIRAAFELVRDGRAVAVVGAGNSGALMAAGLFVMGRLPGVERPAIAVPVPTLRGQVILIDAGANVDSQPSHLVQFALMGEIYARLLCGRPAPRVALLSNGEEPSKGTDATRAASDALQRLPLNFVGYVEGRDLCQGQIDVVVCDGFVGNVVLKTMEGFGATVGTMLRDALSRTWRARLGYLLARRALGEVRTRLDYAEYGGAPLLGIDGVAIVAHGASTAHAMRNAIRVAHDSARLELNRRIVEAVRALPPVAATGSGRRRRLWEQIKGRFATARDGHEPRDPAVQPEAPPGGETRDR